MTMSARWLARLLLIITVLAGTVLAGGSCGSPGDSPGDGGLTDPPCSCGTGDKRCQGNALQVCEFQSPTCASWGPAVACTLGMCGSGSCGGTCLDKCAGGTTRCAPSGSREICRLSGSGCLDWVVPTCPGEPSCVQGQCVATPSCDPACPSSYMCNVSGVCAGGTPTNLQLNVPTVKISGSITLNGVLPKAVTANCSPTGSPKDVKAKVFLLEKTRGYSFTIDLSCQDSNFAFASVIYPGTYEVAVRGEGEYYNNLPTQAFVADPSFVVAADVSGKVLNVRTVKLGGAITLNGAAPLAMATCSATANATDIKAKVFLTEKTQGYSFVVDLLCKDNNFNFASVIYPGTYEVAVRGEGAYYDNLPTAPFTADPSLVVAADVAGKVLNVRTVQVSGSILLNGVAPQAVTTNCNAFTNPTEVKARVFLNETTQGYAFTIDLLCKDSTFNFAGTIYPGTYAVAVRGEGAYYDNLPSQGFVADPGLVVTANVTGKVLNVKTVQLGGSITLNGAAPKAVTANCSATASPTEVKARVFLTEKTQGYTFAIDLLCKDNNFNFVSTIYPGTYAVAVRGEDAYYDNLPTQAFTTDKGLVVSADVAGKVLNVTTVQLGGAITLNGVAPLAVTANCSATASPMDSKAKVFLNEKTQGYAFTLDLLCKDGNFNFASTIYPGTYSVAVRGEGDYYDNLPTQAYVAEHALVITGNLAGKVLNVQTLQVRGAITLNGVAPKVVIDNCNTTSKPTEVKAKVFLTENSLGYAFTIDLLCKDSDFKFTSTIYPGTYSIAVRGEGDYYDNLPTQPFTAVRQIQIP